MGEVSLIESRRYMDARRNLSIGFFSVIFLRAKAESPVLLNLFDPIRNRIEKVELMKAVDGLNHKYGLMTIKLGVEGADDQPWKVKCEQRTPNYLTDIDELMVVRI